MVTARHPECEEIETNNLDVFQQNDEANNDVEIQENEIFRRHFNKIKKKIKIFSNFEKNF